MSDTKPCMIYIFSPWFADNDFLSRWVFNVGNFRHSRYAYLQVLFSSKKQLKMNQQRSEFFKFTNEFLLKSTDVGYSLDHVRKTVWARPPSFYPSLTSVLLSQGNGEKRKVSYAGIWSHRDWYKRTLCIVWGSQRTLGRESHGFQGGTEGCKSLPTNYKGGTIKNWRLMNVTFGLMGCLPLLDVYPEGKRIYLYALPASYQTTCVSVTRHSKPRNT